MDKAFNKLITLVLILISYTCCYSQYNAEGLIEHLESYIQEKYIPGVMISIVQSDSLIYVGGIGYANIEKGEKVSDEHLFRQGSIAKSFTALGLYQLLKEFPYDLNSPIANIDKHIPFSNDWEEAYPVRVVHLLEHTSGFDDFHLHAVYNSTDSTMPPVASMVNAHAQSLKSRWQPGTKKAYSNPNYVLAGHLIEVLSSTSFDQYIKENILEAIPMESSGFYFKQAKDKAFAQPYRRKGTTLHPIGFATINGSPAGGFCANAKDMAAYLQFMLKRDSSLFTIGEFNRIETSETSMAAQGRLHFGYGLGNYCIWKNGYLFHGHGGQIDGFSARYLYARDADLGVAVAINRNGDANAVVDEILNYLLGRKNQVHGKRKTKPISETLRNEFAGFYEFNSPRNELLAFSEKMFGGFILDFREDMLIRKRIFGRPKDTLYYAGENQFYYRDEGVPSAMLIANPNTKPGFWINDSYTEKASRTKRLTKLFGLLFSFLILGGFFVYSFIWLIRNSIISKKKSPINHLVLFGFGVCFILMLTGFGLTAGNMESAMHINFSSLLMFLSSLALFPLALLSIYRWKKLPKKKGIRIFFILASMSAVVVSIYFWNIGFIGLKLWNY